MIRTSVRSLRRYLLDRMVLRPTRHPLEHHPQQRVLLEDGSVPLECFVQRNFDLQEATAELLILKFPGTAGRAERSSAFPMPILPQVRAEVWTWNPPGYGSSGGKAGLAQIARSALEFHRQALDRQPKSTPHHWLCGNSLGSVVALHVAASLPDLGLGQGYGLLLRNPPPLKPVVKRVASRYPVGRWIDPVINSLCEEMDVMETAKRVHLPAVFLQSELDSLVPLAVQNELVDIYRGPLRTVVMQGLDHADLATDLHLPAIEEAIRWLWQSTHCNHHDCNHHDSDPRERN